MSHKAVRIGITALVLVAAFTGLMYATLSDGTEYYKHVDEVMANPAEWQGKKMQVHGFAKDVRRTVDYKWRFELHNNGQVIHATYSGIAPDTFQDDAEVVMKGVLLDDGTFAVQPNDGIMAKCPSKYEAQAGTPNRTLPAGTY